MLIIKKGNSGVKNPIYFICDRCGCEFIQGSNLCDYDYSKGKRSCFCPYCNLKCYPAKEVKKNVE